MNCSETRRDLYNTVDRCKIYTPRPLAEGLVGTLGDVAGANWLEPSFGKGVFVHAISSLGVPRARLVAVDLETDSQGIEDRAMVESGVDFLTWSLSTSKQFDRIVGNPPYIPYSRMPESLKLVCKEIPAQSLGTKPNGSSNLWFYFLCACLDLLRKGGSLGFVLPAAWEYADYASPLRERLGCLFQNIYSIRSQTPLFPDVQEGSIVLVCDGFKMKPTKFRRFECGGMDEVVQTLNLIREESASINSEPENNLSGSTKKLSDYLHVQIGAVTGDASYFLMKESRRKELSLPQKAMRPVLSRSRQLTSPVFRNKEWKILRDFEERVWLFRPPGNLAAHPAVAEYLNRSKEDGGCNKESTHVTRRKKWYLTELPRTVHGFISGMSTIGPWIAFNQMPGLSATNTLYTVTFNSSLSELDRYAVALAMLSSDSRKRLEILCRVYPDGLRKHEPRDILSLEIQLPNQKNGVIGKYIKACGQLIKGNVGQASKIADKFIKEQ